MAILLSVIMLALIQFTYFGIQVGMARGKYGIKAPAMSGNSTFESYHRVHSNTLEQLVSFIPASLAFAYMVEACGWPGYYIASALGTVWIIGRFIYAHSYVKDPATRAPGFMLTTLPTLIMILGTLVSCIISIFS